MDVFEDLRNRLIGGGFGYGEKLRAEVLKNDYGCSASTVREALLRLSALGLVDFQEQRGFRSPDYSEDGQHDVTEMRILLESEGACRSMQRGGVDWEARLTAAHHKLSHIESRISTKGVDVDLRRLWSQAELEFHQTLLSACGSELLMEMHLNVYHRYRQIKFEADRSFSDLPKNILEHAAIVQAAIGGDEAMMRRCIYAHFERHLIRPVAATSKSDVPLAL